MDIRDSQIVLAVVEHGNGIVEQRIHEKSHIFETLEDDVTRVTFPVLLHNAN